MKKLKLFLVFTIALTAMVFLFAISASAASGTWGDLTWELNDTTGELVISGEGKMNAFSYYSTSAWRGYKKSIKSVTIGEGVTSIGSDAFYDCTLLKSITIPEGVTSIGSSAFNRCTSLTSITIPEGVTSIGSYAFYNCSSLTSITIPDSVTSIGSDAFYGCTGIIQKENGVSYVDKWMIDCDTSVTAVALRKNTVGIGNASFYNCSSLTSITIPDSVTIISDSAFYNCSSLTSIAIPASVTTIGYRAFYNCENLMSITIPDSVIFISNEAFSGCSSLTSVYITDLVAWCKIQFDETQFYGSQANPLCNAAKLYLNGKLVTMLDIPSGVTAINNYAFSGCISITSIIIPDSVNFIGEHAFSGCSNLTSIIIPDSVISIGGYAFTNPNTVFFCEFNSVPASWDEYSINKNSVMILGCNLSSAPQSKNLDINSLEVHIIERYCYTGSNIQPNFLVTYKNKILQQGTDFIFHVGNNVNASASATLSICGLGSYTGLLKTFNFIIEATDISDCVISAKNVIFYGYPCTPKITVKNGNRTLKEGIDYSILLYENTQIGTGLAKIIGIGNYRGSIDTSFSILPPSNAQSLANSAIYFPCDQTLYQIPIDTTITFYSSTTVNGEYEINYDLQLVTPKGETIFRNDKSIAYYFNAPGVYSLTLKITITTYTHEYRYVNGKMVLTQVAHPSTETYNLSIQVTAESIKPQQLIANPLVPFGLDHAFLSVSTTTPYATIGNIDWSSSDPSAISVDQKGLITYHKPGTATITATTEFGSVSWDIEHTALNLSLYGKAVNYNPDNNSVKVYFGNILLTKDKDFTLIVEEYNQTLSRITIIGENLFTGSIVIPYSHKTNRFYTCEHECQLWKKVDEEIHSGICAICYDPLMQNHNWNNGVITTPSTHLKFGVKTYTCTNCDETKTEDVPKLTAHEYGEWQKHTATQHKRECPCTNIEYRSHKWGIGVITTPATHLTYGTKTFTCTDCGETKTEDVAKLTAHEYGDWQKFNTKQHKRVCPCGNAEYTYHSWDWEGSVVTKAATHLEEGIRILTCHDCDETKTSVIEKATQHTYGEWATTKEATTDAAGLQERSCACGHTETKEIPQLESNVGVIVAVAGGGAVALGGGGFTLWWFIFRKKKLI